MNLAEKRQHVVLAHAEELDVLHDHHLVVFHFVDGAVDDLADIRAVAARQKTQRLFDALGRAHQAFALGVFAERFNDARRSMARSAYPVSWEK